MINAKNYRCVPKTWNYIVPWWEKGPDFNLQQCENDLMEKDDLCRYKNTPERKGGEKRKERKKKAAELYFPPTRDF